MTDTAKALPTPQPSNTKIPLTLIHAALHSIHTHRFSCDAMDSFSLTMVAPGLALVPPPPPLEPLEVVDGAGAFFFPNQFIE